MVVVMAWFTMLVIVLVAVVIAVSAAVVDKTCAVMAPVRPGDSNVLNRPGALAATANDTPLDDP